MGVAHGIPERRLQDECDSAGHRQELLIHLETETKEGEDTKPQGSSGGPYYISAPIALHHSQPHLRAL
jgi:hypothetical protein